MRHSAHTSTVIWLVDEAKQLPKNGKGLVAFGLLLPAPLPVHLHRLLPSDDTAVLYYMVIV